MPVLARAHCFCPSVHPARGSPSSVYTSHSWGLESSLDWCSAGHRRAGLSPHSWVSAPCQAAGLVPRPWRTRVQCWARGHLRLPFPVSTAVKSCARDSQTIQPVPLWCPLAGTELEGSSGAPAPTLWHPLAHNSASLGVRLGQEMALENPGRHKQWSHAVTELSE